MEWKNKFRVHFGINPTQFKQNETKLEERCKKYSIKYIPPQLDDSVAAICKRKQDLNKKCKAATDKIRWDNLTAGKHEKEKARMRTNIQKRQSRECKEGRVKRLAIEAESKRAHREIAFQQECSSNDVQYLPPIGENESVTQKRQRRKNVRQSFPTKPNQSKLLKKSTKREKRRQIIRSSVTDFLCERCKMVHSGEKVWDECICIRPPPKETFQVTGYNSTPIYSSGSIKHCAEYSFKENEFSDDQISSANFYHPVLYEDRHKESSYSEPSFYVDFQKGYITRNQNGAFVVKNRGVDQRCRVKDVLKSEIRINNQFFMKVGECYHASVDADCSDGLVVMHSFNPLDGEGLWRWEESIYLFVEIAPISEDLLCDAEDLANSYSDKEPWNGEELYEMLYQKGIQDVEFTTLCFDEFSMRKGDQTHNLILKQFNDQKMTKKHGPSWRDVLKWQKEEKKRKEAERKRKELEENKRKFWRCPNGLKECHNSLEQGKTIYSTYTFICGQCRTIERHKYFARQRTYFRCINATPWCHEKTLPYRPWCSTECECLNKKYPNKSKELYNDCQHGYQICHEGVMCCPGCEHDIAKDWRTTFIASEDKIVYVHRHE